MFNGDLLLHLAAPVILLALIIVLIVRRLYRQFPLFFVYLVYAVVATSLRLSTKTQPTSYFVVYWTTDIIYGILALLVIREVFLPSLTGLPHQYRFIRWLMPIAIVSIVAFALWSAVYRPIGRGPLSALAGGAYSFEVSIRWLELIVFIIAAILVRTRYISLLIAEFGILAGFGFAALLTLAADLSRVKFGSRFEEVFRYLPTSAYIAAAGAWLIAFLYKEPKPRFRLTDEHLTLMEQLLNRQQEQLDKFRSKHRPPKDGAERRLFGCRPCS